MGLEWLWYLLTGLGGILAGGIAGFFIARAWFKNYLKKNPPVNERMIREMMRQMGRTPSEKQVRQVLNSMNQVK
ncbi:YneF family protein [Paracholeplasma manati]|jgi:hypothetical protein|uniref:YneF family protein n=1 Tax=Paracholeplasma manati TaxID=591373 RepID=A0ABT2Y675_9MOLU|nr:YneF family protein [Paracholeplasma manati]MCV2232236.1 YneF family protein [Paracholeplasma manati]MDG0888193.1 YneF family protein [Paracholeplasma manati]MDX9807115.1 YneF family protein [Acholeplasma sp.]